jgi:hypothetical protein
MGGKHVTANAHRLGLRVCEMIGIGTSQNSLLPRSAFAFPFPRVASHAILVLRDLLVDSCRGNLGLECHAPRRCSILDAHDASRCITSLSFFKLRLPTSIATLGGLFSAPSPYYVRHVFTPPTASSRILRPPTTNPGNARTIRNDTSMCTRRKIERNAAPDTGLAGE